MMKRILCAFLTLIMVLSLVPATALTASAASLSVSENAITVLKQWNGYKSTCGEDGYIGYGTACTTKAAHGGHSINQIQADNALRTKLAELDKAINSFASKAGLSLTQSQHDALVLFSFDNGTAWTTGTGSFRSAVVNRLTGTDFLNAICRWKSGIADDKRRMVEANMYLNGVYSSAAPSSFITVFYFAGNVWEPAFDENGDPILDDETGEPIGEVPVYGSLNGASDVQYYDVSSRPVPQIVPSLADYTFTGWYESTLDYNSYPDFLEYENDDTDPDTRVTTLTSSHNYKVLIAGWVPSNLAYDDEDYENGDLGVEVYYIIPKDQLVHNKVYELPHTTAIEGEYASDYFFEEGALSVDRDYVDSEGVRWCRIITEDPILLDRHGNPRLDEWGEPRIDWEKKVVRWVKVKLDTNASTTPEGSDIDVTVTVTNTYVRSRADHSASSKQNGTYYMGQKLRIINTYHSGGFLWGQVARSATDSTPIGWVALMYTDWESVKNQNVVHKDTIVATAVVTGADYVNLRSEAGTDNQIVGAMPRGTIVELLEIKYVNGHPWGRCSTGWMCLSYADVTMLSNDNSYTNTEGYLSYVFTGVLKARRSAGWGRRDEYFIYNAPSTNASLRNTLESINPNITITQVVSAEGYTWGKCEYGWVIISDNNDGSIVDVDLSTAKYTVISDTLTVRSAPSHDAARIDTLTKGVEFDVNSDLQIVVTQDSVWAWAYKVGETAATNSYNGWVNLATSGVSRTNMPTVDTGDEDNHTAKMQATVVNADTVNVRAYTSASYKKVGSLSRGLTVAVWEEEDGWYKVDSNRNGTYDYEGDGWVSGAYLQITDVADKGTSGNAGTPAVVETGLGIVANTYTGVNVRTGAGTAYPANGKILSGTTVEILEVKPVGVSKWGRVTQGWICLDYVTMISKYPVANGNTNGAAGNTGSSGSSNTTASETVIFTGKIVVDDTKVFTEPSLIGPYAEDVRYVDSGTPVTVHELLIVEEEVQSTSGDFTTTITRRNYWARTNDGYILNPDECITLDPLPEKTYTVTKYPSSVDNELKVYEAPGSTTKTGSTLDLYDVVSVTTLQIIDNDVWCRVEYIDEADRLQTGYVKIRYLSSGVVKDPALSNNNNNNSNNNAGTNNGATGTPGNLTLGSTGNTANKGTNGYVNNAYGYRYKGNVIRTGSVNVRSTPSQTGALTTTLKGGAALVIYETVVAESMAWGRCDAGWVYLYYVDLQPCNNAVDAKVVYNENTIAYTDANCSGVAGTYSRMSVVDIYEVVGNMCRTDLGWVHVDNLG